MGFAFKANTNDTRESPAIKICKDLLEEGANLAIHDPKVKNIQIENDLGIQEQKNLKGTNQQEKTWSYEENILDTVKDSDAVLVLTEWEIYKNIDWEEVSKCMRKPAWVFDTRSIINKINIAKTDLNFWRIGDGSLT